MKDYVICKICNKKYKQLGTHLKIHKLTGKEYLLKYPGSELMCESRKKQNRTSSISPNNISHWTKKGFSEEEALLKIEEVKKKNRLAQLNGASNRTIKYWVNKGYTSEQAKEIISNNSVTNTLENYIKKYGEIEGNEKFNKRREMNGFIHSKEYLLSTGMSEEDIRRYKDNNSLEYRLTTLGEVEGTIRYNNFIDNMKTSSIRCNEFFVSKGFSEEATKLVSEEQSRNIEWWKNKYPKNWEDRRNSWIKKCTSNLDKYSKISILFFDKLLEKLNKNNVKYSYYYKDNELYENIENIGYYIDLTIIIRDKKFAIEYQGDYWHANPNMYDKDTIVRDGKKASYFWEKDKQKFKNLTSIGYEVIQIWEQDIHENEDKILNKLYKRITK